MARIFSVLALFTVFPTSASAQDMPLSQILIDGEGWKKVEQPGAKPKPRFYQKDPNGFIETPATLSPDRTTVFSGDQNVAFLQAAQVRADGKFTKGANYAPPRLPRGEKGIDVTGLATDRDGRIYAATELGVQVFDPTGRLCGVLTPAAPGLPESMVFEDDKLTLWIGNTKYARKLNTQGAK